MNGISLDRFFQNACTARCLNRREFLRTVVGTGAASTLLGFSPLRAAALLPAQKTVVVTFGGGARDEETFAPEGQAYIPRLIAELIPQATFYTQVINRGILGHYVATAGLATGCYETFNNFAPVSPRNPTTFEYYRQEARPMNDLVFASDTEKQLDPHGSMIDADMGTYYTWLNLTRLSGAERSRFVACHEGGREAIAVAPALSANTLSTQA